MSEDIKVEISGDIRKLDVRPGDRLVLNLDQPVSFEAAERMSSYVKGWIGVPGIGVLVLEKGMSLSVIRPQREKTWVIGSSEPVVFRNVSGQPELIDKDALIYRYSDFSDDEVVALWEGGRKNNIWFDGDTTNLDIGRPRHGTYRTDRSRGLFQLGSPSYEAICVEVRPADGPISHKG